MNTTQKKTPPRESFTESLLKYFLLIATVLVALGFGLINNNFFKIGNIFEIIRAATIIGTMALGMTVILASGEFDFSAAATSILSGVVVAMFLDKVDSFPVGVLLVLLLCISIGLFNSMTTVFIGIPAFIATLGSSTLFTGIAKYMTGGAAFFSSNWPKSFLSLGQSFVFGLIPTPVIVFTVFVIITWIFTERTKTGRYIYAVGANPVASDHVGIHVKKVKAMAFVICAVAAGFSGIMSASTLGSVVPTGGGNLLIAISTCMLGATFLKPGVFNIMGTVVGSLLLAVITNGLTMVGASYFMKDIVQGFVLLIAVGIIAFIRKDSLPNIEM